MSADAADWRHKVKVLTGATLCPTADTAGQRLGSESGYYILRCAAPAASPGDDDPVD
ncbi:MAG: hypothetical protein M3450_05850 [Actinomycetota bacterium]|nr:hypothetical protein [Actinomycetota bacterium]MDQ3640986.1 hypothetical protein [Actinomycetota bacterium]